MRECLTGSGMLFQHLNALPQRGADGRAARIIDEQRAFRNASEKFVQIGKRVPIDPVETGNQLDLFLMAGLERL